MRIGILKVIFGMAFDSLKSHKLRSFLTLLGIMIGVTTVIGMVSIIQGLNRSFLSEIESWGSDIIIVEKYDPGIQTGRRSEEERKRKDLTFKDALAIEEECSLVRAVVTTLNVDVFEDVPIKYQNKKSQDSVILGMNEKYPEVISVYLPERGRFLTKSEIVHSSKVCVLGSELNEILFPHTDAVGKEIRMGPEKFMVVGVLKKRGSFLGFSQDNIVGIPITTMMKYYPYDLENLSIIAAPQKSVYSQWKNGPSPKADSFVIGVWFQRGELAQKYKDIGMNTYIGIQKGPTVDNLKMLDEADMNYGHS